MNRTVSKLKATLWKCLIVRKKHYILTLFVVVLPILLFALLGYARSKVGIIGKQEVNTSTYNEIFYEDMIYEKYKLQLGNTLLLYSPNNKFTEPLMRSVQLKLDVPNEDINGFNSEDEVLEYCKQNTSKVIYAVIFNELQGDSVPNHLKYDIRNYEAHLDWDTNELFHPFAIQYIPGSGSEKYFHQGFITLKMAIDTIYMSMKLGSNLPVTLAMQEFPYPPHVDDLGINDMFMTMLPFVTLFSFILICPATLRRIVEEKDSGIKELMKMMGLPTSIMWLTWFIDAIVVNAFSIIFIVVCMKVTWGTDSMPIEHCDALIFGIFLLLYCSACIALCFVISTLLSSPNFTTVVGILFWNISYLIPYSLGDMMKTMAFNQKMLFCLFPNVAMYYGYEAISIFEIRGMGVQWNNLFTSASGGANDITVGHVFLMLLLDIILFLIVTYYIDSVRPGKYGLGKPWTFPIKDLKRTFSTKRRNSNLVEPVSTVNNDYVKIELCSLIPGIKIENLYKTYKNNMAVNDLSIDFYQGEITVLLGHNGAGKTTTMSIISGMIKASKGNVFIDEFNINDNIDHVRSMIGICPQHNLLFPDLSVKEHFKFFAMLNNVQDAESKIDKLLQKLGMYQHRNKIPSALSGGMKRKLCLGMALILEPKVLILDEPTSGLDPKSRREIWDILLKWRKNENLGKCTVLISTHFMEEAEVLGDRIAIMDHGNLIAFGTSMFLKNEYSTGYILTVIKNKNSTIHDDVIDATVLESVPEAKPKIKMQTTNTYALPNDKVKILKVIKNLESKKAELQIDNIGISITTLEDVFLRISKLVSMPEEEECDTRLTILHSTRPQKTDASQGKYDNFLNLMNQIYYQSWILIKNHFSAFKKLWLTYLIYVLLCLFMILLTLLLGTPRQYSFISHKSEIKLDLSVYGESDVFCSSTGEQGKKLLQNYQNIVRSQKGMPTVTSSVSDGLIQLGIDNIEKYKQHAIVAAEFNETAKENVANIMYSNLALHGAPISLNLMMNAIAKTYINPEVTIETNNVPLPSEISDIYKQQSEIQIGLLWMLLVPMGLTFVIGIFLIHPFRERSSKLKHLLYMTGAKSISYWLQMFVFDIMVYFLISILIIFLIFLSWNPIFHHITELGSILCILMVYGIVAIPYVYLFSYKKSISSAISLLQILNLFTGVVLTAVVLIMQLSRDDKYEKIGDRLHVVCNVSPQYWLTYNLLQYARKAVWNYNWDMMDQNKKMVKCHFDQNPCCFGENTTECWDYRSYFIKGLAPVNTLLFLLVSFIYFGLLLVLDSVWLSKVKEKVSDNFNTLIKRNGSQQFLRLESEHSDNTPRDNLFSAINLYKKYGGRPVVNNVSFNVKEGACFGLLGVNGAGKTTTFKMLTGSKVPNYGTAEIKDQPGTYDLMQNRDNYLSRIGYCPQFNAMNSILTGRELLTLFSQLRGVSDNIETEVQDWINVLGLIEYADVPCGKYSGGNKRKLSLGMSLIGNLNVIMLDEPTSGVDPLSRRNLWNVLRCVKSTYKQSIILTSHSMDECEALCDELAIIKAGQIKCLDNIPNLKIDYGKGFTVLVKVKKNEEMRSEDCVDAPVLINTKPEIDNVEELFKDHFKFLDPTLKDKHLSLLHFYLPNIIQLSDLFERMELFKNMHEVVEDYTINMATLEDVFLSVSEDTDTAAISKKID